MFGILQYLIALLVLVTFVYGVQFSLNSNSYLHFKEKNFSQRYNQSNSIWTYDCIEGECTRKNLNKNEKPTSLQRCNMLCDKPSLWPKPRSLTIQNKNLSACRKNILIKIDTPKKIEEDLKQTIDIFMANLPSIERPWLEDSNLATVFVNIKVTSEETKIQINTNESYKLTTKKTQNHVVVNITAPTYFGARHGLETLSQLIIQDSYSDTLQIFHDIEIEDSPSFPHRGLMLDTARNFFPKEQLIKIVDGMAMNKLNVFHLHLTDAVSFPIVLPNNPWMAEYGAYGPDMTYSPEDIQDLVEYARIRGIRVILEIDAPSHANEGWNHWNTATEKTIICGEQDVFNGHLNPDSEKAQKLLESIYSDLLELGADNETFHIGGDEVNLDCLRKTKSATNFNNMYNFWADIMNKMFKTVTRAFKNSPPKNLVIWSSGLTDRFLSSLNYSENLVIQYWFGNIDPILANGHKIIFSTVGKWYLDCGFGSWKPNEFRGVCDPYTPWQTFYNYRPWRDYLRYKNQVLGGEACLWTEQVSVNTVETRIWPRASALAERLWSDVPLTDTMDVSTRMSDQTERLIRRGLKVAAVWPRWCSLNPGKC